MIDFTGYDVYHWKYGKGRELVVRNHTPDGVHYVLFDDDTSRWISAEELSFTPYTLEGGGFSQVRPVPTPEKGDLIWVKDNAMKEWRVGRFHHLVENGVRVDSHYDNDTTTCWEHYSLTNPYDPNLKLFK